MLYLQFSSPSGRCKELLGIIKRSRRAVMYSKNVIALLVKAQPQYNRNSHATHTHIHYTHYRFIDWLIPADGSRLYTASNLQ